MTGRMNTDYDICEAKIFKFNSRYFAKIFDNLKAAFYTWC